MKCMFILVSIIFKSNKMQFLYFKFNILQTDATNSHKNIYYNVNSNPLSMEKAFPIS